MNRRKLFLIVIAAYSSLACTKSLTDLEKKNIYKQLVALYDKKGTDVSNQLNEFFLAKNISEEDLFTILDEQSKIVFDKIVYYNGWATFIERNERVGITFLLIQAATLLAMPNDETFLQFLITLSPAIGMAAMDTFFRSMAGKYQKEKNIIANLRHIIYTKRPKTKRVL